MKHCQLFAFGVRDSTFQITRLAWKPAHFKRCFLVTAVIKHLPRDVYQISALLGLLYAPRLPKAALACLPVLKERTFKGAFWILLHFTTLHGSESSWSDCVLQDSPTPSALALSLLVSFLSQKSCLTVQPSGDTCRLKHLHGAWNICKICFLQLFQETMIDRRTLMQFSVSVSSALLSLLRAKVRVCSYDLDLLVIFPWVQSESWSKPVDLTCFLV